MFVPPPCGRPRAPVPCLHVSGAPFYSDVNAMPVNFRRRHAIGCMSRVEFTIAAFVASCLLPQGAVDGHIPAVDCDSPSEAMTVADRLAHGTCTSRCGAWSQAAVDERQLV